MASGSHTETEAVLMTSNGTARDQRLTMSDHRDSARRKRLPKGYSGQYHLSCLLAGCSAVSVVCISLLKNVCLWEISMLPLFFLLANGYEYVTHRYPGHHLWRPPIADFFKSHVGVHHKFFTYHHMYPDQGDKDLYFVLFPLSYYAVWLLVVAVPTFTLGSLFLTWNLRLLITLLGALYILNYELFHSFSHNALPHWLQKNLERVPGMNFIRHNHRLHHHPRMMTSSNFNLTYPFFDWMCGSLVYEVKST